jgi:hypothetical protein
MGAGIDSRSRYTKNRIIRQAVSVNLSASTSSMNVSADVLSLAPATFFEVLP